MGAHEDSAGQLEFDGRCRKSAPSAANPTMPRTTNRLRRVLGGVSRNRALARLLLAYFVIIMAEYGQWLALIVYAYLRGGASAAGLVVRRARPSSCVSAARRFSRPCARVRPSVRPLMRSRLHYSTRVARRTVSEESLGLVLHVICARRQAWRQPPARRGPGPRWRSYCR